MVEGEIIVSNRKRVDLVLELQRKGFTPFPKTKGINTSEAMETEENEETPEVGRVARASDYEYLLSMPIGTLTLEKVQELLAEKGKQEMEVEELKKETPKSLWMKDLDAFITTLGEHENEEAQVEEVTGQMEGRAGKPLAKASKQVGKNPRKNNTKKANDADTVVESVSLVSTTAETGHVFEGVKSKGRGALKKAPTRKVCLQILKLLISQVSPYFCGLLIAFFVWIFQQKMPTAVDSEVEDDEVLEPKERTTGSV
ncbi:DNA topoisomerase 2-like [Magnolia sinica]|uniref:DNA topoisomerase 2-like n=1 Tax=Magnolia sinica TaxID=86752 RepID=UPI0026592645|nr:DNA topoisomerase 2-like [Magnolia sinica]